MISGDLTTNRMFDYIADGQPVAWDPVPGWDVVSGYDMTTGGAHRTPPRTSRPSRARSATAHGGGFRSGAASV